MVNITADEVQVDAGTFATDSKPGRTAVFLMRLKTKQFGATLGVDGA